MHTKFERLLWKSLTTLEVMTYYLVVHTGPVVAGSNSLRKDEIPMVTTPSTTAAPALQTPTNLCRTLTVMTILLRFMVPANKIKLK